MIAAEAVVPFMVKGKQAPIKAYAATRYTGDLDAVTVEDVPAEDGAMAAPAEADAMAAKRAMMKEVEH